MFAYNFSTTILILFNVVQMVTILLLLLPLFDFITLSKNIEIYTERYQRRLLTKSLAILYTTIIVGYGIVGPTRTLNSIKTFIASGQPETPKEKLIRIINSTNATKNYLLAGFSLFYILVTWRLFDYIKFSAKLYEFSNLMGNYNLIDITTAEAEPEEKETFIIEEDIAEDNESVHWPSVVELSRNEQTRLRTFFKETPKKSPSGERTPARGNLNEQDQNTDKISTASKEP